MSAEELQRQIERQTESGLRHLSQQLVSGVIPFVGAGMSADFGYRQWNSFLLEQAKAAEATAKVQELLKGGFFEEAAQVVIEGIGQYAFDQAMQEEFGDHKLDDFEISGAISMLPKLSKKHVVTTNFDHVLETVFRAAGPRVNFREVITGTRTQAAVRAVTLGRRALIKIHGDVAETQGRILTKADYDRHYGRADLQDVASTRLTELMKLLLSGPLLFLGCSLEKDRVVAMLKRLYKDLDRGLTHFAVLAAPDTLQRLAKRRDELASMGIWPIWYPAGQYGEIPNLLAKALGQKAPEPHEQKVCRAKVLTRRKVGQETVVPELTDAEIDKMYWEGVGLFRAGKYQSAREKLSQVAAARPNYQHVQAYLEKVELGELEASLRTCEEGERWQEAVRLIEERLRVAPGDPSLMKRREWVRKKAEFQLTWQEAGELFRRENWEAVIDAFQQMEDLEPGVKDSEGWLETARRQIQERETKCLIEDGLRKATKYFESGEWTLAVCDLDRVLELDPGHEVARELRRQSREKAAEVKAAETLAQQYGKAVEAIRLKQWEKAADLLKIVTRGDARYKDAKALLKQANRELDEAQAELKINLSVRPAVASRNSTVTWTLKVQNSGRVPLSEIVATELRGGEAKGGPVEPAFRLGPGESKSISMKGEVKDRGVRRHFEVVGKTPGKRSIREVVKTSVNLRKEEVKPPEDETPDVKEERIPTGEEIQVIGQHVQPSVPGPTETDLEAPAFWEGIRLANARLQFSDYLTLRLITLLKEGEVHYGFRVASTRPAEWAEKVETWQAQTAQLKLEKLSWVSLGVPSTGKILQTMKTLAREIQKRIGVEIPLHEFEISASART